MLAYAVPRGSDSARRALAASLTRLGANRPRHAAGAARLTALLTPRADPHAPTAQ